MHMHVSGFVRGEYTCNECPFGVSLPYLFMVRAYINQQDDSDEEIWGVARSVSYAYAGTH